MVRLGNESALRYFIALSKGMASEDEVNVDYIANRPGATVPVQFK